LRGVRPSLLSFSLARRNLAQERLRALFSVLSVALGTAVIIAADFSGSAIRRAGEALGGSDAVPFVGDLLNAGLSVVGLSILLVAGFLIFNAFGMSVTQRQRQIGALRSLGMMRRQIGQLVLAEALLTGGLGVSAGALLGPLLGWFLLYLLAAAAGIAHGQGTVTAVNLLLVVSVGLGITLAAAAIPAWRALRISPLAALRATGSEAPPWPHHRLLAMGGAGLLLTVLPLLYLAVDPPGARQLTPPWDITLTALFALSWLTGWALLLPLILRGTRALLLCLSPGRALPRLIADNLIRAPGRATLTILTLGLGLLMMVTVSGVTTFTFNVTIQQIVRNAGKIWLVEAIPFAAEGATVDWGVISTWDLATMRLSPEFVAQLDGINQDRAASIHVAPVVIPELAMMPGWPAYVIDIAELRHTNIFIFSEGSWETAESLLQNDCGLLLIPRLAAGLKTTVGDMVTVTGAQGPVRCVVAGIGSSDLMMGVPFVSQGATTDFAVDPERPFVVLIQPYPETDIERLLAESRQLLAAFPDYSLIEIDQFLGDIDGMVVSLQTMLNGMLLLAIVAAALGVTNTTLSSVIERRAELGLLRAVGGTRRQALAVVMGEAGLLGLVGGGVGALAGLGLVAIFILVNGGNMFGLSNLDLGDALRQSLPTAVLTAIVGLVAAPLVTVVAAYWPAAYSLQGTTINTLKPEYIVQKEERATKKKEKR
jgi:putative ABC transport system permease protein